MDKWTNTAILDIPTKNHHTEKIEVCTKLSAFIVDGYAYRVDKWGETFCAGKIPVLENVQTPPETTPKNQEPVSKVSANIKPHIEKPLAIQPKRVLKHKTHVIGRPKKKGKVSRITMWRRKKKAEQGILL